MKVLEFLNGKKTVIAAIVATVIGFAQTKMWLEADVAQLALTLNGLLLGVGVGHKIQKNNKSKNESK